MSVGTEDDGPQSLDETSRGSISSSCSDGAVMKPMSCLDGPPGWPLVGNFLTYLKKENRGKLHEVQVSK